MIEVPDQYVCERARWESAVIASGRRVFDPNHKIFTTCQVFETYNTQEDEWVMVHEIPASYIVRSYPFPGTNNRFGPNCQDSGEDVSEGEGTPAPGTTTAKRSGKLQGKKATGKASSSSATKDKILDLGGVQINLTTLYQTVVEYLKKQMQSALEAKVEEVKGELNQAAEGYAQVLYQDFLFWLNEKVHAEIGSQFPIDSQEFENEFMAWLNSPGANVKKYINQYISEQSPTIGWVIEAYQDQASWEIAGGLKEIWGDAKTKYDKFTRAYDEVLSDPQTPYAETLNKYGFSGPWIDKFKSYEGQFNVFNDRYKAVEAVDIVTGAFQSDVPRDKINALFNLMELMGGVAEDSNIPIVSFFGQVVKAYGNVANSMLSKIDDLAKKLRERQGFCLGVGTTTDERNVAFVKAFGDATLVCPTSLSPDIYERVEPPDGRIYFWAEGKFIEGQERGGGVPGVREAVTLITEAGTLGYPNPDRYRGKESDIATIARFYNTQYESDEYGSGIPGLRKESEATIDGIGRQIDALRSGIVTVGEHACKLEDLDSYLQNKCGLMSKFSLPGSIGEASFGYVKRELKVFYAVSYVDGKGGAYKTYSEIWKKMKPLSILTLNGYVREKGKTNLKCPRCAGAAITLALTEASEMEGCKVAKAGPTGDFVAYIMTTSLDFNVSASATAENMKSEELRIDKTTLGVDKLPFVNSFSFTLAVPFDDSQAEKDLKALLDKLKELKERALALNAKRSELNNFAAGAGKAAGEAEAGANSANEKLVKLESQSTAADEFARLCSEATGIADSLKSSVDNAEAREKSISDSLTNALNIAQTCDSMEDAQMMRDSYKNALTAMKEFSNTKTRLQSDNKGLKEKLGKIEDIKRAIKEAGALVGGIGDDVNKVNEKAGEIDASVREAEALLSGITAGSAQLRAETEALYGTLKEEMLTDSIKAQFDEIRSLVASADTGAVDFAAITARGKELVTRAGEINTKAQQIAAKYENASCDATPADDIIARMDGVINSMGFEIAVTSELPQRAADCIAKLDAGEGRDDDGDSEGELPEGVAQSETFPDPTPSPPPAQEEPEGELPEGIAQSETFPDPTPSPPPVEEEPGDEIDEGTAGSEEVPDSTPPPVIADDGNDGSSVTSVENEPEPFYVAFRVYYPDITPKSELPEGTNYEQYLNNLTTSNVTYTTNDTNLIIMRISGDALQVYSRDAFTPGKKFAQEIRMTFQGAEVEQALGRNYLDGALLLEAAGTVGDENELRQKFPGAGSENQPVMNIDGSDGAYTYSSSNEQGSGTLAGGFLEEGWSDEMKRKNLDLLKMIMSLCFVATAVYGDWEAPQLDTLRYFRDSVLLKSETGAKLVTAYYKFGPQLAIKLFKNKSLAPPLRALVDGGVRILEGYSEKPLSPPARAFLFTVFDTAGKSLLIFTSQGKGIGFETEFIFLNWLPASRHPVYGSGE